jgi:hypothetical protein
MMEDVEFFRVQQQQQQAAVCLFVCLFVSSKGIVYVNSTTTTKKTRIPKKRLFLPVVAFVRSFLRSFLRQKVYSEGVCISFVNLFCFVGL